MSKLSKRQKALVGKIDSLKLYPLMDALGMVKEHAVAKFDESIDVAVQLGVDAKKSDQVVRGAVVLPNGTGKTARVAVFAQGAKADEARAAGADIVGMDDLAAEIKAGKMDFDVVIGTGTTHQMALDGASGEQIQVAAGFTINLGGYVYLDGTAAFEKKTAEVVLADGASVTVDALTVGASAVNALLIEAMRNSESAVTARFDSRSWTPCPRTTASSHFLLASLR